jgi:probable rRNA maturation factor
MLMLDVEITTRSLAKPLTRLWPGELDAWEAMAEQSVEAALHEAGHSALLKAQVPIELYIGLVSNSEVQALNKKWRGNDAPTNVLSFEAEPGAWHDLGAPTRPMLLGDIILAYETIAGEAQQQAKTLQDHTAHLIVHGVLHLLGYDHQDEAEADAMEGLERRALARLGIADPYANGPIGHE